MNFLYFESLHLSSTNVKLAADVAEISKDAEGHIGIAIGGGAPFCPCLYVVKIFEGSPVALDGRLSPGDEILAVNGFNVRGSEKTAVAKHIKQTTSPIKISFSKLCFDEDQGQTFDIALKKLKHWFVESMDENTADALGLSRAVLSNDLMTQLMDKLELNSQFYKSLIRKCSAISKNYQQLAATQDAFGSVFCEISVRESLDDAKALFAALGECHKNFKKEHLMLSVKIQSVIDKLQIYVDKAIPDTKNSIKKYMGAKCKYLAFCLKAKELEDEETTLLEESDYLPRLESGNYEYRIILRCRESSRKKFLEVRKHVMVKIEILDEKHVRELALYLKTLIGALKDNHSNCYEIYNKTSKAFINEKKPKEKETILEDTSQELEDLILMNSSVLESEPEAVSTDKLIDIDPTVPESSMNDIFSLLQSIPDITPDQTNFENVLKIND